VRYNTLGVQVTNVCNLTCAHCITDSSPSARGDLAWPRVEAAVRGAAPYVDGICVTGGEPLLRRDLTLRMVRLARDLGLRASLVTNGYWARTAAGAGRVLAELADAGLDALAVSFDRFHDRLVDASTLATLLTLGATTPIEIQVQYCGDGDDDAYRVARELAGRHGAGFVTAKVLPFGRGRDLVGGGDVDLDAVPDSPCGVVVRPVLTPEDELFTCCGPARGASRSSPLRLTAGGAVGPALAAGADDPILNLIHTRGPRALLAHLSAPVRERVRPRLRDGSICSLCRAVTDDEQAVGELRDALSGEGMRLIALSAVMRAVQDSATAVGAVP
jgi:hypothetical protein